MPCSSCSALHEVNPNYKKIVGLALKGLTLCELMIYEVAQQRFPKTSTLTWFINSIYKIVKTVEVELRKFIRLNFCIFSD